MSSNLPSRQVVDRYLFIGDQGTVCSSAGRPTSADFAQAGVGIVTILDIRTGRFYARDSRWLPIPAAELVRPEIKGRRSPRIHAA